VVENTKKGRKQPSQAKQLSFSFVIPTVNPKSSRSKDNRSCEIAEAKRQFELQTQGIVVWGCSEPLFSKLGLSVSGITQLADDYRLLMLKLPTRKKYLREGRGSLTITDCTGMVKSKNVRSWLAKHPESMLNCCVRYIDWDGRVTMIHYCSSHRPNPATEHSAHFSVGQHFGKLTVVGYSPEPTGEIDPMIRIGEYRYLSSYPDLKQLLDQKEWGVQFTFGRRCTCIYTLHPDPTATGGGVAFRPADHLCTHCRKDARQYA